jgi:hypothetical protein
VRRLSTAYSASDGHGREGLRALVQGGLQPPVPLTTDGVPGLRQAVDLRWPRSLRMPWAAPHPPLRLTGA